MVFRIQAELRFANAAQRDAGLTTIANAISGRNTTVVQSVAMTRKGSPALYWEAEEQDTGDAGIIYALIQAMTTPLARSKVNHHTCFHGDNTNRCLVTAEKVW
jgi:hypothetical protein